MDQRPGLVDLDIALSDERLYSQRVVVPVLHGPPCVGDHEREPAVVGGVGDGAGHERSGAAVGTVGSHPLREVDAVSAVPGPTVVGLLVDDVLRRRRPRIASVARNGHGCPSRPNTPDAASATTLLLLDAPLAESSHIPAWSRQAPWVSDLGCRAHRCGPLLMVRKGYRGALENESGVPLIVVRHATEAISPVRSLAGKRS